VEILILLTAVFGNETDRKRTTAGSLKISWGIYVNVEDGFISRSL